METTTKYISLLRKFKHEHASEYGIKRLGIFGSVARGEQTENSDLDIVYESETMNLWDDVGLWQELEMYFGKSVDVVGLHKYMNPLLKQNIEKEAIYV
ncbi:MAG: nucleotidyltransferase family protein [Tannerella sp.]|jgi:predicted nucleotidyltransferase|nr:nucleotidyltransferase family protein [Tannerella sp.]